MEAYIVNGQCLSKSESELAYFFFIFFFYTQRSAKEGLSYMLWTAQNRERNWEEGTQTEPNEKPNNNKKWRELATT